MKSILISLLLLFTGIIHSQVGINTTTPNAQLDIRSTNQVTPSNTDGILIPKVDAFPLANPTADQNGMMVYLTTVSGSNQPGFYYWDNNSTAWVGINSTKTGWTINGNSGTVSGTDFIGTIDANDLDIRTNNTVKIKVTQKGQLEVFNTGESVFIGENAGENDDLIGNENTFIGYYSGGSNTSGYSNTGFGKQALFSNIDGYGNFAFGNYSLNYNNGYYNGAFGTSSLFNNTTGNNNLGIGYRALYYNTAGNSNIAIGESALSGNVGRSRNLAIGHYAMYNAYNNSFVGNMFNIAIGHEALRGSSNPALNSGWQNTAIGDKALFSNTSGGANVAVGMNSLHDNTTGGLNVAVGNESMYRNTTGFWNVALGGGSLSSNTTGHENNVIGYAAMALNTTGINNVGIGKMALYNNNSGNDNIGIGHYTLYNNINNSGNTAVGSYSMINANRITPGMLTYNTALGFESLAGSATLNNNTGILNTAIGALSLRNNSSGESNVAVGHRSLFTNSIGNFNVSIGKETLFTNSTGIANTANGFQSLYYNTTGSYNVANGYGALLINQIGNNNVAVGSLSMANVTNGSFNTALGDVAYYFNNYNNSISIGYNSAINADNQVRIGNPSITSIGGYTSWTNLSDSRFKRNIKENVPGLNFILKLHPVTYNLDTNLLAQTLKGDFTIDDKGKVIAKTPSDFIIKSRNEKAAILQSGFIAQEVEKVALDIGYDFSGIDKPKNKTDFYGLRYAEFVVPLVKAIQEQQSIITSLQEKLLLIEKKLELLESKKIN